MNLHVESTDKRLVFADASTSRLLVRLHAKGSIKARRAGPAPDQASIAIVMIQGSRGGVGPGGSGPGLDVQAVPNARAQQAGQALLHYRCETDDQILERLARIDGGNADIILLDPGRCGARRSELSAALVHLQVP